MMPFFNFQQKKRLTRNNPVKYVDPYGYAPQDHTAVVLPNLYGPRSPSRVFYWTNQPITSMPPQIKKMRMINQRNIEKHGEKIAFLKFLRDKVKHVPFINTAIQGELAESKYKFEMMYRMRYDDISSDEEYKLFGINLAFSALDAVMIYRAFVPISANNVRTNIVYDLYKQFQTGNVKHALHDKILERVFVVSIEDKLLCSMPIDEYVRIKNIIRDVYKFTDEGVLDPTSAFVTKKTCRIYYERSGFLELPGGPETIDKAVNHLIEPSWAKDIR